MTIVERLSLREQLAQFRQKFERLDAQGRFPAEACELFQGICRLMEMMVTLLLERATPDTSANSSLPGSMTPFNKTAKSRPAPEANPNLRTEVSQETIPVEHCQACDRLDPDRPGATCGRDFDPCQP